MKLLKDFPDWKAVHFPGCTYLKKDLKIMSAEQREALLNMKVTADKRKGHFRAI